VQNATDAVLNKMRVAIKKTDHVTRGRWTPGKYDVVCSAHNGGGGRGENKNRLFSTMSKFQSRPEYTSALNKYCLFRLTRPYLKFSACNPSYFISFSQQAQSWNICMPNISNAKKKNPGHLYLTFFTGLPVTLSTQLFA
jgi:hypothetical protein